MDTPEPSPAQTRASPYAWYVLSLMVLVYIFNFIDRQILSVLANDIKRDLGVDDSYLGFLYGTAFGVFYALFGVPLGRLADNWNRVRLLTVGMALWSTMTALSGFARNIGQLTAARIGVGVGEATAGPVAYSLLGDWFPKRQRATALAIYSAGLYLGGGISLFLGAWIKGAWTAAYPVNPPLGLAGWQAAFLAVGVPGLLLALWVSTLREPVRGASEGIVTPPVDRPFAGFLAELVTIIPPLTLIGAARRGAGALAVNVLFAGICVAGGWLLTVITHKPAQWIAVGTGVYAVFSWASALRVRDPATFRLIWGTPAFLQTALGYGLIAYVAYAISFWGTPYAERILGADIRWAALFLGAGGAIAGAVGATTGGWVSDRLRRTRPNGRIAIILAGAVLPIPFLIWAFTTQDPASFYFAVFMSGIIGASFALGPAAATTQDLVLPRMRGTATATFFLGNALVGLALGPSIVGIVSDMTGSLQYGLYSLLAVVPIAIVLLLFAWRSVPQAEATLVERARAAGEQIA